MIVRSANTTAETGGKWLSFDGALLQMNNHHHHGGKREKEREGEGEGEGEDEGGIHRETVAYTSKQSDSK